MNTKAETVLQRFADLLAAAGIGASVERTRVVAFERDELPGVIVRPKAEQSDLLGNGILRCSLTVEIEVATRGDIPDQLADPIAEAIQAAVRADQTLGGLVAKTWRTGKDWEFEDADGAACKLLITYTTHYVEPA